MFSIFTLSIKFNSFDHFSKYLFLSFVFDKLDPHWIYVSKDVLNHCLVYSTAYNRLKSAKKVFISICILVDMPMGGL